MYKLNNDFTRGNYTVTVVGCGGTGGYVVEGLCRLLPREAKIVLVDHDRVEERNLARQNFFKEDLGKIKSEALALRLARNYGRPVAYSIYPIALTQIQGPGIIAGCVDNGLARRDIASKLKPYNSCWWIDSGNGENYGQILIGNSTGAYFDEKKELCIALPLPTIQKPELLAETPKERQLNCVELAEQGPTINQIMAALVIEVVRKLISGNLCWMQLYLDMEAGTLRPVLAYPEEVIRLIGKKKVDFNKE